MVGRANDEHWFLSRLKTNYSKSNVETTNATAPQPLIVSFQSSSPFQCTYFGLSVGALVHSTRKFATKVVGNMDNGCGRELIYFTGCLVFANTVRLNFGSESGNNHICKILVYNLRRPVHNSTQAD